MDWKRLFSHSYSHADTAFSYGWSFHSHAGSSNSNAGSSNSNADTGYAFANGYYGDFHSDTVEDGVTHGNGDEDANEYADTAYGYAGSNGWIFNSNDCAIGNADVYADDDAYDCTDSSGADSVTYGALAERAVNGVGWWMEYLFDEVTDENERAGNRVN